MTLTVEATDVQSQPRWVGTSWKMTKTLAEARAFVDGIAGLRALPGIQPFVLPAHTALAAVRDHLPPGCPVLLGAQNAHWGSDGAATGEVSMRMVKDAGAALVEIGHSERRALGETDSMVAAKVRAALLHGLIPLLCVGEHASARAGGDAVAHVTGQVRAGLSGLSGPQLSEVLIAYEPVWAIGAAGVPATVDQVAPVLAAIDSQVRELSGGTPVRALLYGGGVDESNASALLSAPRIQGLFVGRAGWSAAGFLRVLDLVSQHEAPVMQL